MSFGMMPPGKWVLVNNNLKEQETACIEDRIYVNSKRFYQYVFLLTDKTFDQKLDICFNEAKRISNHPTP